MRELLDGYQGVDDDRDDLVVTPLHSTIPVSRPPWQHLDNNVTERKGCRNNNHVEYDRVHKIPPGSLSATTGQKVTVYSVFKSSCSIAQLGGKVKKKLVVNEGCFSRRPFRRPTSMVPDVHRDGWSRRAERARRGELMRGLREIYPSEQFLKSFPCLTIKKRSKIEYK